MSGDHDPFQDAVPDQMRKRLHINLVHHGRGVCQMQKAKCSDCVSSLLPERDETQSLHFAFCIWQTPRP